MIDNFTESLLQKYLYKGINDKYGHNYGDKILSSVAHTLRDSLRKDDVLCRWGGEEFLIIVSTPKTANVFSIGEKLRKAVEDLEMGVTISVGLAELGSYDIELAVKNADKALYIAKNKGRNRVEMNRVEENHR